MVDWIHKHGVVTRTLNIWAMWLITVVVLRYTAPEQALSAQEVQFGLGVIGILSLVVGALERWNGRRQP